MAWRSLEPSLDLATVLCFRHERKVARDNTVKYRWRTLQLLPGRDRPSYAGARVDVLEGPDGELAVRYHGQTIRTQLAPPRAGVLRASRSALAQSPALERIVSGLDTVRAPSRLSAPVPSAVNGVAPRTGDATRHTPTPREQARWKAIRQAQLQGLSMRATARLLGISRNTVSKYLNAGGPPGRLRVASSTNSDHAA